MKMLLACIMILNTTLSCCMWRINENDGTYGLKFLHIGFQLGCIKDFEEVAKAFHLDVTSWYVLSSTLDKDFFDGCDCGNEMYNISSDRAQKVWNLHKDFFEQFDVIVTSDTAPLARIFLENGWNKPQIIWVCNRFDYCHGSPTKAFPDVAYYKMMHEARYKKNVFVVPYTDFEYVYAQSRGVNLGTRTIRPIGSLEKYMRDGTDVSAIPSVVDKPHTLFLYPRFDYEYQSTFIQNACNALGIKTYCGSYNGPKDLEDFKAVLYMPYQWSNIALFENIQRGIIHFVPTARFLKELIAQKAPIRGSTVSLMNGPYQYCDWYHEKFKDLFVYFDSWNDLKEKVDQTDYELLHKNIIKKSVDLRNNTLNEWSLLFAEIVAQL